jgi:hypothetical protein
MKTNCTNNLLSISLRPTLLKKHAYQSTQSCRFAICIKHTHEKHTYEKSCKADITVAEKLLYVISDSNISMTQQQGSRQLHMF